MSSELRLYNTLTRALEPFVPRVPGTVQLYVCGPTTYDIAHAGNARSVVAFDVFVRHLAALGYRVNYVRNITDVDDKIIDRAKETGEDPLALSSRMALVYQADMRTLNCLDPTHEPKVSENIEAIVALIETLIAKGHAYEAALPSGARDVYFSVKSFPEYGKLSRRNVDELEVGARIEPGESKRDPLDFALWKGSVADGWGWDSPWGRGRPGWHIECSAMAAKYLGYGFDVHGGGMDLIFPHHENEIAQSEAAHPEQEGPFARVWMHNGFLNVDKEKMSKSLGNFVRPRDVYEANDPEALRYWFLGGHYRGPIGLDIEKLDSGRVVYPGVDEAERRIDYMYATLDRLDEQSASMENVPAEPPPVPKELEAFRKVIDGAREKVTAALNDDLNTPAALAVLAELLTASNELCDGARKRRKDERLAMAGAALGARAAVALRSIADVLGLLRTPKAVYEQRTRERRLRARGLVAADIERQVTERAAARASKDFARADVLRKSLDEAGIELFDGPSGTTWKVKI